MIVVIAAMEVEAQALLRRVRVKSTVGIGKITAWVGVDETGVDIAVVRGGVGMAAAACATTAAIERFHPKLVVNIGCAGGIGLAPMTSVAVDRVVQSDMDTTAVGDEPGYLSDLGTTELFPDQKAVSLLIAASGGEAVRGTLASADRFVAIEREKDALSAVFAADCCDMEGAAVAHACEIYAVPYAIFRTVSDSGDADEYRKFLRAAAERAAAVMARFLPAWSETERV